MESPIIRIMMVPRTYRTLQVLTVVVLLFSCSSCSRADRTGSIDSSAYKELIAIKTAFDTATVTIDPLENLRAKHPSSSDTWRVLSLNNLVRNIKKSEQTEEARYLADLGWVEGYIIDREHDDVLLLGSDMSSWPGLYSDELLLTLEKALERSQDPYCSLDPVPEYVQAYNKAVAEGSRSYGSSMRGMEAYAKKLQELWGPQEVVVGGVPKDSHHSYVMLEADYLMKKMAQGLVTVPPIVSMMDLNSGSHSARFWFNCKEGHPTFRYDEDITIIDQCDVVVLTEAQGSTSSGEHYDSGEENPEAEYWAEMLSTHYKEVAVQVEVFAQLENLYRLYAAFKSMSHRGHISEISKIANALYDVCQYRRVYEIPDTYPGLTNYRIEQSEDQISFSLVSGGVSMNPSVSDDRMRRDPEVGLDRQQIIAAYPNNGPSSFTERKRKKGEQTGPGQDQPDLESGDVDTHPDWTMPSK